jgi:WD40 repeat protein
VDTLLQVSFEEPLPPRRLQFNLPTDLETICLKCLRKVPQQRYDTAQDLAEDLRRFQKGEPIRARPVTPAERALKWIKRQPVIASLLAGIVVVTALAFLGILYALWETRLAQQNEATHRKAAELALDRAERSVYFGNVAQARSQWLLNNIGASAKLLNQCQPRQRGWEWHYLNGLNHTDLLTIADVGGSFVTSVAYGLEGRWLAVGGGSPFPADQIGIVQVFDPATGQLRWRRNDLRYFVRAIAWSPDGKRLASGGGNWFPGMPGEVKVWDADTGQLLHDLKGHANMVTGVAFSPDGLRLASTSVDETARVWDLASGQTVYKVQHAGDARSVVYSPDGRFLITAGNYDGVRFWAAETGKALASFRQARSLVAISPDGKYLASDSQDGARVWQFLPAEATEEPRLEVVHSFSGHNGPVLGVTFSPDGRLLATASADSTVRTWNLATGQAQAVYRGHEGRAASVSFHPDGHTLASGAEQPGHVKLWDLTRPVEYVEAISFGRDRRDVAALRFTADGNQLLALGVGGLLRRWDCASGLVVQQADLTCTKEWLVPAVTAAFSGDGRVLAAVSRSDPNDVNVMETTSGRHLTPLRGHTMKVWHVALDHAGERIATAASGTRDGRLVRELKVWDATTGRVLRQETSTDERCDSLALSRDGAWLVESRRSVKAGLNTVLLSEAPTEAATPLRFSDLDGVVRAVGFTSDGNYLAAASESGAVRVWTRSGKALHERPLQGPPNLNVVAFSPDGSRLAAASRDRVQVWDTASGQDILFLRGAGPRPNDNGFNPLLAWSPDGSRLAASNWNRTVSVWETADPHSPEVRARRATRAAAAAFVWHRARAENAAAAGATFAYAFHSRRLEALKPPSDLLRQERGDFFVRCGAWDLARADFAVPFATDFPKQAGGWLSYALVLLQTGGRADYERLRARSLDQFADKGSIAQVVRAGGLTPLNTAESERFLQASHKYNETWPRDSSSMDYLGLAYYRANQWKEADQWLRRSAEAGREGSPLTSVTLALVHLRQGNVEQAKPWLTKVDAWLAAQSKVAPTGPVVASPDWDWHGWLTIRLLRREAEELLP